MIWAWKVQRQTWGDFPNPVSVNSVLQHAADSGLAQLELLRNPAQVLRGRHIHLHRLGEGITVAARWLKACCCGPLASRLGHKGRQPCKHFCATSSLRTSDVQLRGDQARTNSKRHKHATAALFANSTSPPLWPPKRVNLEIACKATGNDYRRRCGLLWARIASPKQAPHVGCKGYV